jgi:chromosome segregation ATPase
MQTEIDHFLKEQNDLLSQQINLLTEQNNALNQQVSSLKNILSKYSEVEQSLQNKISNLNTERETQQALILAMKSELSKLELGSFSEQLQQAFQNNVLMQLQTPLTRAL